MQGDVQLAVDEYPVNEIFASIQGEGRWSGIPAVFLRLQGCPVGCRFCDTKYTWDLQPWDEVRPEHLAKPANGWVRMTVEDIVETLGKFTPRHVVITGGEPCQYDLTPLTEGLAQAGKVVQVETSGTMPIRVSNDTWITVSPKYDMPGGLAVIDECLQRADEIKIPVGRTRDVENLELRVLPVLKAVNRKPDIWLQPISQSEKASALCVEMALARGYGVSIQAHKYLGLR